MRLEHVRHPVGIPTDSAKSRSRGARTIDELVWLPLRYAAGSRPASSIPDGRRGDNRVEQAVGVGVALSRSQGRSETAAGVHPGVNAGLLAINPE
jgi:hypothetical protein